MAAKKTQQNDDFSSSEFFTTEIVAVGEADEPGGEGSETGVITGYIEARDGARVDKNRCHDGTQAEEGTADEGGRGGEASCRKGAEGEEEHFRAADAQRGGRVEKVLGAPTVPKMYSSGYIYGAIVQLQGDKPTKLNKPESVLALVSYLSTEMGLIADWYHSVHRNNLTAIVFHDHLNERFIARYTTHNVRFVKVPVGVRSNRDERFNHYLTYLNERMELNSDLAPKNVFMTNLFNNPIAVNPFSTVMMKHDSESLFVTRAPHGKKQKEDENIEKCLSLPVSSAAAAQNTDLQVNSRMVGGSTKIVVKLLQQLVDRMQRAPTSVNCHEPVLNSIIDSEEWRHRIRPIE